INALGFEIDNLSEKLYFKYRIPKTEIRRVNYSSVRNCKTGNYKDKLKNKFNLRSDIARASNEILEATSLPSVNFAISFTPPETGNINKITTKRADFGASINVSIPVSQYFLRNTYQKQFAIDVARLKLEYDNSLEENENETRSIERRIKSLENSIETTKKSIVVERNKINYIFSRIKEGQDNIISYYQQLDTYEALQINLKEEEKELEFQKVLLYFIS
ncbi:TolC family protein, partial [Escherichia coli]|nr:TolC family protein [Escherichia coli]